MYFKKKESWFESLHTGPKILLVLFIAGIAGLSFFLFYRIYAVDRKIFHLGFIPLLLGLIYELRRVTQKWSTVFISTLIAFLLSFFAFSHEKNEKQYVFDDHLQTWPYFFLGCFVLVSLVVYLISENVNQITEGVTLLFTISINYWILANGYWNDGNVIIKALVVLNWIASLFTLYHSLSYHPLGKVNRVLLSLWYAFTGIILAADNCYKLYQQRNTDLVTSSAESWLLFCQYFLLGVSSIYIVQNLLLAGAYFIPSKNYGELIREAHDAHLKRFSKEQVYIIDAVIIILISVTLFTLNYFYEFVPINFMIWATIALMTPLFYLVHRIVG